MPARQHDKQSHQIQPSTSIKDVRYPRLKQKNNIQVIIFHIAIIREGNDEELEGESLSRESRTAKFRKGIKPASVAGK